MELFQRQTKNKSHVPFTFTDSTNRCKALRVILNRSDVLFWTLDQLHGSFSEIGAHQNLQKPNFVMPELLIKELCLGFCSLVSKLQQVLNVKLK